MSEPEEIIGWEFVGWEYVTFGHGRVRQWLEINTPWEPELEDGEKLRSREPVYRRVKFPSLEHGRDGRTLPAAPR